MTRVYVGRDSFWARTSRLQRRTRSASRHASYIERLVAAVDYEGWPREFADWLTG